MGCEGRGQRILSIGTYTNDVPDCWALAKCVRLVSNQRRGAGISWGSHGTRCTERTRTF